MHIKCRDTTKKCSLSTSDTTSCNKICNSIHSYEEFSINTFTEIILDPDDFYNLDPLAGSGIDEFLKLSRYKTFETVLSGGYYGH